MADELMANDGKPRSVQTRRKALISCGILKDEVEAALKREGLDVPVFYLAPAPCIEADALERQLVRALERALEVADDAVVLIGLCHRDVDEIIARFPARRLAVNDCFDAILGARRKEVDRAGNTFYTIPAWLRHWKRALVKRLGWDGVDARQNFGLYERIILLDAGVSQFSDEEVLELFDFTGIPIEVMRVDLAPLARLLRDSLGALLDAEQAFAHHHDVADVHGNVEKHP